MRLLKAALESPATYVIGINGEFYNVVIDIDTNIRAIQWYGDKGEIEFVDGSVNQTIDSIDINKFISAWDLGKKKSNKPNIYSVWDDTIQDWFEDIQLKEEFEKQEKISSAKKYLTDTDFKKIGRAHV